MKRQPHGYKDDPATALNKYGLTAKQEQFCQAYLLDFNIAKAERLSGYANGAGHTLMKREKIRQRIHKIRLDTGKALDITRERLLQELMRMVYADSRKMSANPDEWDEETAAAVASFEMGYKYEDLLGDISGSKEATTYVKAVRRWDKPKAIELLNKMLGYNEPEKVVNKNFNYNSADLSLEEIKAISAELEKSC